MGCGSQWGKARNIELSMGIGVSTEQRANLVAFESFEQVQEHSLRAHIGFSYRFLSLVGTSGKLQLRYFYPFTIIDSGEMIYRFRGILDGKLRLQFRYKSKWNLFLGARFEDFTTNEQSVTYFTTRVYGGLGWQFK